MKKKSIFLKAVAIVMTAGMILGSIPSVAMSVRAEEPTTAVETGVFEETEVSNENTDIPDAVDKDILDQENPEEENLPIVDENAPSEEVNFEVPASEGENEEPLEKADNEAEEPAQEPAEEEAPAEGKDENTDISAPEVKAGEDAEPLGAEEEEKADDAWTVTFYNRDAEVHTTVEVAKGDPIGDLLPAVIARDDYDAYWAVGEVVDGAQGKEIRVTGDRISEAWVPTADSTIVPDYEQIKYTVTFYEEDKTTVAATKTVTADTNYCVNDIPDVPAKSGSAGKWVYSGGDFGNTVAVNEAASDDRTLTVWAEYEQKVFTVKFIVEENEYNVDTYYTGDSLTLPADPVIEGKEFVGWFIGETEYKGGEKVTSDLNIVAEFNDEFSVSFIVMHDDETEERLSQYFRTAGEKIGTMPQNPFVAGKVFEKWVIQGTDTEVNADTVVDGNMIVEAVFRTVTVYNITTEYYYESTANPGTEVVFNTDLIAVEAHELPYTITAPASTQTSSDEVPGAPIYYPENQVVEVTADDFDENHKYTVRVKYVPYTALYDVVYMLKDLTGDDYTEIDRTADVEGVLNSYVTPEVKNFDYAVLELAEGAVIETSGMDGQPKQELQVKYTRKNFQLSYETNGGSYVSGTTVPYGTSVNLPSTNPTRDGYNFEGWYSDAELTNKVTGSVTVNADTVLYANWTGKTVSYTIVYMLEKYDNETGTTSYVYDNSRNATGQVGTTVYASSAPNLTGNAYRGYERDTAFDQTSNVTIAADGSSVLVVHYNLIRYTIVFNINRTNGRITIGGQTYTGSNYRIENVVLGQDISSMWPATQSEIYDINDDRYFDGWTGASEGTYITKRYELIWNHISNANNNHVMTYTASWSRDSANRDAQYWLQQPDGTYKKEDTYTQIGLNTENLGAKEIEGYSIHNGIPTGYPRSGRYDDNNQSTGSYGKYTYRFYYDRAQYKIDYYFGSTNLTTKSNIYFEADISGTTYNYTPDKPANTSSIDYSDYTWGGWYEDSALQNKYTFDKMPGHNLALYAKWVAPTFTVNFVMDGGTPAAEAQTITKYERVEKPENPTKTGYTFEGWFTTADGTEMFDWNTQITKDTTIYAHWTFDTLSYTVHYVDENGEAVAPDKTVSNPNFVLDQEVTEKAIAVTGYRPDDTSKSIKLAIEGNEITFVYTAKSDKTYYSVYYILDPEEYPGDEIAVAAAQENIEVPGNTEKVVELAAAVDYNALYAAHPELKGLEFYPDDVEKTMTLASDVSKNVIKFYYSSFRSAKVTVNFVDMNGDKIADPDTQVLKVGKTFTLSRTPIAGWELNKAVEGTAYDGKAAGDSYKITEEVAADGSLTFTLFYQKKVTITAKSLNKQYDGTELKLPADLAGQVTVDGLLDGHALSSVSLSYANTDNTTNDGRINAGVATVTPGEAVITGAKDNYYAVRYISGTLTVTKINVTVRIEPDRWTGAEYNGELYYTGFTNPGKGIEDYVIISHEGYKTSYLNDIWNTVIGLESVKEGGKGLGYYVIAEKDAGEYPYELGFTDAMLPVNDNYSVNLYVREGRLQILPITDKVTVTVTENSGSEKYDGEEKKVEGYTVSIDNELYKEADITFSGEAKVVGTDAGSYPMELKPEDFTNTNENFTNVEFVIVDGTLEIAKRTVTLTSATEDKVYDGTPLTNDEVTVGGDGFATGEGATYDVTGTQTDVGESKNTFTYKLNENTKADNYEITTVEGTLTVTELTDKVIVTITENSGSEKYDGEEKKVEGYTVSINNKLYTEADFEFKGDATVKGTDAGSYDMELEASDFTNKNKNFKEVEFVIVDGTLEISKRTVTITSADGEKVYDGTPLTKNTQTDITVGGDGFAENEGATYVITGSQTEVGSSANAFTYKLNEGTKADNYDITKTEGTLTVTELTDKVTVTITEHKGEFKYDGAEKTVEGYDVEISNKLYTEDDFTFSGNAVVKGTDAGSYPMELKAADFKNISENFAEVEFVIVDGTLEISKRAVTFTSADDKKVYDGAALTNDKVTVTGDGFVQSEGAAFTVTGTQTDVGESKNTFTYKLNESTKADNYEITTVEGTLTVTALTDKVTVTITENSGSETYDGTEKTVEGYTVSIDNELYTEDDFTFSGKDTVSGTDAGTYPMELKAADFANTNKNFTNVEFVIVDGELKIEPKAVTITTGSDSKEYDGTSLTKDEAKIEGLVEGESVTLKATGSQTEVGSSDNTYSITWDKAKEGNYTVTDKLGTLEVTKNSAAVTLTAGSGNKTYDGKAITYPAVTAEGLPEGFTAEATASGSQTDAGESKNVVNDGYVIKNAAGVDKTANFTNVTKVDGTLTVNPAPVTVTTGSDSKKYDGTPLTKDEAKIEGLVNGETATVKATGSQTEVGSSDNTYSIDWGTTKKDNYTVTDNLGKLTVTTSDVDVVLTAASDSKTYDGKALTNATVTATGLPEGFTYEATASGSQTDAGESANTVNDGYKFFDADGNDKTENFTKVVKVDGTLTVNPKAVTITTGSGSKEYDGTPLTNDYVQINGLVEGESVTLAATGTITEVGSTQNTYSITWDKAKKDNYTVTETLGTLEITKNSAEVTLTAGSDSKTYDGKALTKAEVTAAGLPEGFTYEATASGSQTDAGESKNVVNDGYKFLDKDGNDKTANFTNVKKVDGTLTVNPAPVTITTGSSSKEYDGTPLTKDEAKIEGLVEGESVTLKATGTITEVGKTDNTYSITWDKAKKDNYTVTETLGTLEITKNSAEVTLTAGSDSKTYDGKALTKAEVTAAGLPEGFTYEATASGSQTDAGESKNVVNDGYKFLDKDGNDKTANFTNVKKVDGTLKVEKKAVTLKSADLEKVYDGTALINNTTPLETEEGFIEGEGATYKFTGSQTDVGSSANAFTYTLKENTKAENYDITKTEGTLKVTAVTDKVTVTITEHKGEYQYSGAEKTVEGYDVEISNKLYTEDDFTFSGNAVVKGTDAGSYPMELKAADFKNISENFAEVEFVIVDGTLEITKRAVTLTSATDKKVYDGKALTNDEVTVSGDGFVENEGAAYDVTGTQTLVGSSANTFTYTLKEGTKAGNYDITTVEGTLTVTDGTTPPEEPVDDNLVVKKSHEGDSFGLGDTVTFTIEATNIYEEARTITLKEIDGVTLAQAEFKDVPGGETITTTATYTITEADILAQEFTNTVTATVGNITKTASDTVTADEIDDKNGHITITKETTSTAAAEDGKYALDETIEYKITVLNDGNLTITEIEVDDELTGDKWTIDSLAPGESKDFETNYVVTEEDILAGEVVNEATGKGKSPDPEEPEVPVVPGVDPEPTEEPNGHITITKETTSTAAAEDGKYALDETIEYKITVLNDGNLTITEIEVDDELTGDKWTIDSLAPGESKDFETSYVVTEEDILAGEVVNEATGKGKSPDPEEPEVPVVPGVDPEPTEEPNGHITITKETTSKAKAENGKYALNEAITYKITIKNDGNLTITDIEVEDELTGDKWTIESLAPGEETVRTTSYIVTEEDILAGEVVNEATGKGKSPDPEEPEVPVVPGIDPEPTEEPNGHLTVDKVTTSKPAAEDGKYAFDETITYKITVLNDGNLTITDIEVEDELTGDKWTIESLAPGESEEFETSYVVTKADCEAGEVLNVATAKGISPDPEKPDVPVVPGKDPEPTEGPVTYKFTKGMGQHWVKGSTTTADFEVTRSIHDELAFSLYLDIEIDGVLVDKSMYRYEEGCVELYISPEFMEKLALGEHTIKSIFKDGEATTNFFVDPKPVPEKKDDQPKTGDSSNAGLWAFLMVASLLGMNSLILVRRKRRDR